MSRGGSKEGDGQRRGGRGRRGGGGATTGEEAGVGVATTIAEGGATATTSTEEGSTTTTAAGREGGSLGDDAKESKLVGMFKKKLRDLSSSFGAATWNRNWNNSVYFDDFEYEEDPNQMPLLLLDKQLDLEQRRYSRRHSLPDPNASCGSLRCFCKVMMFIFLFILVGVVGGFLGFLIACLMGNKGTLATSAFYNAVG